MTYIEFFDKDACENICSCVFNPPDRVILIGNNKKLLEKQRIGDRIPLPFREQESNP